MNPLHEQFIAEARELIYRATDDLVASEQEGFSEQRVDRIFRAFHTLKGSAGIVELPAMSVALHAAEDLLAALHAGRLVATKVIVDSTLACLDLTSRWVDEFAARGSLPTEAGEDARIMAERLRRLLSKDASEEATISDRKVIAGATGGDMPKWIAHLVESARAQVSRPVDGHSGALVAVSYEPRADCFFHGDDPIALMRQIPKLLALHIEARETWAPPTEFDPFACNLRLQGLSAADRAELSGIFRLVPDQVHLIDISADTLWEQQDVQANGGGKGELIRAVIDEQRRILDITKRDHDDFVGRVGAAARAAANALRHGLTDKLAERIERAGAEAMRMGEAALLRAALDEVLESSTSQSGNTDGKNAELVGASTEGTGRAAERSLRVDEAKIDSLVDLAGELIVVKNSFAHLARQVEAGTSRHEVARAMRREHDAIDRLATEMHAAVLRLRMLPAAQVFRPFPRLVRDMSHRLNKRISFVTRGETTESDKTILDRLFEPLLHVVRNAIDHGVEPPQERRAAGKPEVATIAIEAERAGDRFVVKVTDDGRGIDPAAVRRKAGERGLLSADELAALSDLQAVNLVFAHGFSTAALVSDISGRGVGMDVVRTTVEQIGGRVSITSSVGVGTTVSLDLPVNIALSRIMVVEAGGQAFGVSMDAVSETVRLTPDRIRQIKSNEGFVLRDRVVPICPLAELMNLPQRPKPAADARLLVVTEANGKVAALEVDAVRDRLEAVLKPMQGLLSGARGYAGTTLLGNGEVLLVLDLKEILP
jgi:two-component system, chemotaxis family, sensor kinase CheA